MRLILVSVYCKHYVWLEPGDPGEKSLDCLDHPSGGHEHQVALEILGLL